MHKLIGHKFYKRLILHRMLNKKEHAWMALIIEGVIPEPYEARFGSIMEFLMIILQLEPFSEVFDPELFKNKEREATEEEKEKFVDEKKAIQAIKSVWWWSFGKCVFCLGAGLHEMRMFCRGCRCHRVVALLSDDITGEKLMTYFLRRRRYQLESGQKQPCVARGMLAPEFAAGRPIKVLENSLTSYRQKLWADIAKCTEFQRNSIVSEYDTGTLNLVYVAKMKHSAWMVIPLRLLGSALQDNFEEAREIARDALRQAAYGNFAKHHPVTEELLIEDSEFKQDLIKFGDGAPRSEEDTPAFVKEANWFELVEVNELSIERLHHLGAVERQHGYAISPAGTSYGLRSWKSFEDVDEDETYLDRFAQACSKVRSPAGVIEQFQLQNHPEIKLAKDKWIAKGHNPDAKTFVSHKLLRDVFYHCDDFSLYQSQLDLKKVIGDARRLEKQYKEGKLEDPLKPAKEPNASEELARQGLHHKAAFEHFKAKLFNMILFLDCWFVIQSLV